MPFNTMYLLIAVVVLLFVVFLACGYVKAPPDTAYIISGLRRKPKVLIGKAGIKIPFLEKKDALNLQLIPIDVKTSNAVPTADYININVDAAVNVKISDRPELLQIAAQNFLNRRTEYICNVAREVLEGNMREIVGKMELQEMVSDRQKFAELVKQNAEPDLAAMGLDIVSFNVQNFVDDSGVIENLGVDNIVKIQKSAAIARAESEKEIAKARAMAKKEANDAEVAAELDSKCFREETCSREYFFRVAQDKRREFWVAEKDGKLIACAGAEIDNDTAEIESLAVDPDYRRQGVGTILLLKLLSAVRKRGANFVVLEVRPSNTAAIKLYESFGLKSVGRRKNYYRDNDEDALIMWNTKL